MSSHPGLHSHADLLPLDGGLVGRPRPDVSVVVPAFNEADALPLLASRISDVLGRADLRWELILVDDGSRDGTAGIIRALVAEHDEVRGRLLAGRQGKSLALVSGLRAARGRVVVTMDADLQDLPEEIPRLLSALRSRELDVVQAWRERRNDTPFKRMASWAFNRLCSAFSGLPLHDVNCGFKAMQARAARSLRLGPDLHRFIPVLLHRQGFAVGEEPVRHARRAFGRSKYGWGRYVRGFSDLVTVVLLPRLLQAAQPAFGPIALLCLLGSAASAGALLAWGSLSRMGLLWEAGLTSLGLAVAGLLALVLSLLARAEDRPPAEPRIAEELEPPSASGRDPGPRLR